MLDNLDIGMNFVNNIVERASGPMKIRLVAQPAMAVFLAVRAGLADAKAGRVPYFWSLLTDAAHRRDMLKDGWKGIGHLFLLAMVLDAVFQVLVLHHFRLLPALVIAILLAIVPYLVFRGLTTRLARR